MLRSWLTTFRCAANGVIETIARERNMRVHVVAALAVALWGSEVPLELVARVALIGCVLLVLAAEVVNTAFESLVDLHTRERREEARRVKDAAAGAVLVLAAGAVCVAATVALRALSETVEAARRLGPLLLTDVGLLCLAATLVTPMRRPVLLDKVLTGLGGVQLAFVAARSASLPMTALAGMAFVAIAAAAPMTRTAQPLPAGGLDG